MALIGTLTFAKLANVQTVGIGLYLALGVIQAVSSGGVAGLRRRANALQNAVNTAKLTSQFHTMHDLQADVSRLEIGFSGLNRTILKAVAILFFASIAYFGYCTMVQDYLANLTGTLFVFGYYLLSPIVIFLLSAILIAKRCEDVKTRVNEAEARFLQLSLSP
jgi:hypothetical protein